MKKITEKQGRMLRVIGTRETMNSSGVFGLLGSAEKFSLVTVKRELALLGRLGFLESVGNGRAAAYRKTVLGRLVTPWDAAAYLAQDPDVRSPSVGYDFELWDAFPKNILSDGELGTLDAATKKYQARTIARDAQSAHRRELERFVIELSWKSSKIEGNTYTLLDTEKLLRDGIEAAGHDRDEATMIRNHKSAFQFILENRKNFLRPTRALIEHVHGLLAHGLPIAKQFRKSLVGVTGTAYRPLDNHHQIAEAVEQLLLASSRMASGYEKSLVMLVGLSYIQAFEDANKRTARLVANAVLLAHDLAPLSYRSVNEESYRESMLLFYEQESLEAIKKIFMEQYLFATENYSKL